ncbi:ribosome maturation factor RimM [Amorphus sp. MBR-141]
MADRPRKTRAPRAPAPAGPAADPAAYVVLAEIGAAHGVRGAAKLRLFAEDPASLTDCGPLVLSDGRTLQVTGLETAGGKVVARFEGVPDRTAVETLRGETLWLPRDRLPAIDEDDTFYHVDLLGLAVVAADGETLGTVKTVQDFGAGDLIEIDRPGAASFFLPFTEACVPQVDIAGGRLVVAIPPGLLGGDDKGGDAADPDGPDDGDTDEAGGDRP